MMRLRIRTKLTLSFFLIALVTLAVSGMLFYALVNKAVTKQAYDNLQDEAQIIFKTVEEDLKPDAVDRKQRKVLLRMATRTVDAAVVFVQLDKEQHVLLSNLDQVKKGDLFPLDIGHPNVENPFKTVKRIKNRDFLVYAAEIPQYKGTAIVLLAPQEIVRGVMLDMIVTLLKGFLITSVLTLLLGFVLSRSLTKPVQALGRQIARLGKRDFSPPEVVRTGDELEEVSRTFAKMVAELKRYDQAQSRFLQNASHELKTPLMAIQGYAEGIKDGIFRDEEAQVGLDVIVRESARLKQLVDELIYLSKLETMEDVYHPSEQDFAEIARDSLTRLHSLALQKNVELQLEGDARYLLYVDRDKMLQVLINLLSNGIRHARSTVVVVLSRMDDQLLVVIRDDGIGFTDPQEQIFQRFYKGDKGDTGLGLAICKAIVEKSGGQISARNGEHGGAEFHLLLPMQKKSAS